MAYLWRRIRQSYSVMEFIDGIDLNRYLKEREPFKQDEAKELLLQISNGIKEIHSLNILHRDLNHQIS